MGYPVPRSPRDPDQVEMEEQCRELGEDEVERLREEEEKGFPGAVIVLLWVVAVVILFVCAAFQRCGVS